MNPGFITVGPALALMWLAGSTTAQAASFISDDFESGTLLTTDVPPGRWSSSSGVTAGNTLAATSAGAHRGSLGLQLIDANGAAGGGPEGRVFFNAFPVVSGTYYVRTWFRLVSSNDLGTFDFLALGGDIVASPNVAWLRLDFPGNRLSLTGVDISGTNIAPSPAGTMPIGSWHLLELGVVGLGTASGTRQVWVDGVSAVSQTGIDWTGISINFVKAGEVNSIDQRFTGTLQWDDLRSSLNPPASSFSVEPSNRAPALNDCVPAVVTLRDSVAQAPAPAPYDVVVDLTLSGAAGAFYSNPGCTSPTATALIAAGATAATTYFKPTASGAVTLHASQVDFVSGYAALSVTAVDGGPSVPLALRLGCGCQGRSPPSTLTILLLMVFFGRRLRALRPPSPAPAAPWR